MAASAPQAYPVALDPAPPAPGDRRLPAIAAIVVLGLVLRLLRIQSGLPDFLDEAIPFRRAFEMWGWDRGALDLNPHLFHYPSLTFYLHFLMQSAHYAVGVLVGQFHTPADYYLTYHIDPTSQVVVARMLGVIADGVTIACVARIGERLVRGAGIAAAAIVACSPLMVMTSRAIFADSIMTAFAVAAIERMLAYGTRGGRGRLVAAAVLTGLATGAKYPAGLLVPVLAWVVWRRDGAGGIRRVLLAAGGAFAVFVATTPYAIIDFTTFREDFVFLGALSGEGHLGSLGGRAFGFYAATLVRDLGWPCALLALASLPVVLARRVPPAWTALWFAVIAFGAPIALAQVQAQRYLVPIIPAVALLASLIVFELARRLPGRWRAPAALALVAVIALQPVASGVAAARAGADDTQIAVRRWCEQYLGPDALMLHEAHSARLPTARGTLTIEEGPAFHAARPELQARYRERRTFRAVVLPLVVSGRATAGVTPDGGAVVELPVFPHAVDLNRMFYDRRMLQGVDVVVTSSAVRDRFAQDTVRFAIEHDFYRTLDRFGVLAAEFRPGGTTTGPVINVYRIDPGVWRTLRTLDGTLPPLWWAEQVPVPFRRAASRVLTPEAPLPGTLTDANDLPVPWVRSLAPVFWTKIGPFANEMALQTTELGRYESSAAWAASLLAMDPSDISACLLYVVSTSSLDRPMDARAAAERTIGAAIQSGRHAPDDVDFLRVTWADLLYRTGEPDRARAVLEDVIRKAGGAGENADRARALLDTHAGLAVHIDGG